MKCEEGSDHNYRPASVIFAKDANGVAFRGGGAAWHAAAKFSVFVCTRCLDTKEVCIAPVLQVRGGPQFPKMDKLPRQEVAPKGRPLYDPRSGR